MIVIADMGATKTDWSFAEGTSVIETLSTSGFNPYYYSTNEIIDLLKESFSNKNLNAVKAVYLYGAGCSNDHKRQIVEEAVAHYFSKAKIEIEHDLLGSARALCGRNPGIACILGTGSNTCLYDGMNVIANNTSLGFLLGDEGSGAHIGKELVRCYYYGELPSDISKKFEETCKVNKDQLLDDIYATNKPNALLASFAIFVRENITNPTLNQIVRDCMDEFFRRHIYKYDNYNRLPINFIGSIAFYFQDILKEVASDHDCTIGTVVKAPVSKLIEYHAKSN